MSRLAAASLVVVLIGACSANNLGGGPMTSTPTPPISPQQAQDTLIGYLKKTLQALPPGTTLDATRYAPTNTPPCQDVTTGTPPRALTTIGDLTLPSGTDPQAIVAKTGDIWKSWGWNVVERDGFDKPNRFGYAPDGYSLQIEARSRPGFAPSLQGVSPCFPADLPDNRSPFPTILTG